MPMQRTEQPIGPVVIIIREHNDENQGKCHLCALTEQKANGTNAYDQRTQRRKTKKNVTSMLIQNRRTDQPMERMVIIREHTEEN